MKIDVYMPREDSHLLQKEVLHHARGSVLDMGTGSGIQAETAASLREVKNVIAIDIMKAAVDFCKQKLKSKKIKLIHSDLFKKIPQQKFDTIIFNPPYLPDDKAKHPALDGGKKGYEVLEKFLNQVNEYLDSKGCILIVFSSLTNKDKVDEIIQKNMLQSKLLNTAHFFFEDLYVYKITKTSFLQDLEKKHVKDIAYLAEGKRGIVYKAKLRNKIIAIKTKHPLSKAQNSIDNEAHILKLLNKHKIGPKFLSKGHSYLIYEFIEGLYIKDWLSNAPKSEIKTVFTEVLKQCNQLDKLHINKEEMHHPLKHIIINQKKPKIVKMIDFERAHKSKSPKNTTQFLQFIRTNTFDLKKKGINLSREQILDLSINYKKNHKINELINGLGL